MGKLIGFSIDLSKIDKSKIIKGKKGELWYSITLSLSDGPDKFGNDVSLWDNQSKEDRERRAPRKYLGNGRTLHSSAPSQSASNSFDDDNLPW